MTMDSRRYAFIEPDEKGEPITVVVSEAEILETYYPWWQGELRRLGRDDLISPEQCLEDWMAIHWAAEMIELDDREELLELVRAILKSTREDALGEQWTIRAFLEQRGVYTGNMQGSRRLVAEACEHVLERRSPPPERGAA